MNDQPIPTSAALSTLRTISRRSEAIVLSKLLSYRLQSTDKLEFTETVDYTTHEQQETHALQLVLTLFAHAIVRMQVSK